MSFSRTVAWPGLISIGPRSTGIGALVLVVAGGIRILGGLDSGLGGFSGLGKPVSGSITTGLTTSSRL